jgi:hypothetical protein
MKQIHCHQPHKHHAKRRARDFARHFNLNASPHGVIEFDKASGQFVYNVVPKHPKRGGHTVWDSWRQGTRRRTSDKAGNTAYVSENNLTRQQLHQMVAKDVASLKAALDQAKHKLTKTKQKLARAEKKLARLSKYQKAPAA